MITGLTISLNERRGMSVNENTLADLALKAQGANQAELQQFAEKLQADLKDKLQNMTKEEKQSRITRCYQTLNHTIKT